MSTLSDPTMAGVKDPVKRIRKLQERIVHLEAETDRMNDQIEIMQCEIRGLQE